MELQNLIEIESARLREHLGDLNPILDRLVEAAATAHARHVAAEREWRREGSEPKSPWLKVSRDALRDYQSALRLMLKHATAAHFDPLEAF